MASAIRLLVADGTLPAHFSPTADFCEVFDRAFDLLNSQNLREPKLHRRPYSAFPSHDEFIDQSIDYISKLKPKGRKSSLPCLEGWVNNLRNLQRLFASTPSLDYVLTRHINQDMLENMFSEVRQRGGNCENPTAQQFRFLYRAVCVNRAWTGAQGGNCEADDATLLSQIVTSASVSPEYPGDDSPGPSHSTGEDLDLLANICSGARPATVSKQESEHSYSTVTIEPRAPTGIHGTKHCHDDLVIYYLAGAALKAECQCKDCLVLLTDPTKSLGPDGGYRDLVGLVQGKQYAHLTTGGLIFPTRQVFNVVKGFEDKFAAHIATVLHLPNVKATLKNYMLGGVATIIGCSAECSNRLLPALARYYASLRFHNYLSTLNTSMSASRTQARRCRKYVKLTQSKTVSVEQ